MTASEILLKVKWVHIQPVLIFVARIPAPLIPQRNPRVSLEEIKGQMAARGLSGVTVEIRGLQKCCIVVARSQCLAVSLQAVQRSPASGVQRHMGYSPQPAAREQFGGFD